MKTLNIAKYSVIGFIFILIFFHIVNTTIDPTWQPISEYALGKIGWLMNIAFMLLGLSFLAIGIYVFTNIKSLGAKIGGILLMFSSIGSFLAGIFNTDPVGTLPEQMTISGNIHVAAAGLLGFMILSTFFITYQFYKLDKLRPFRTSALMATILVLILEIGMILAMAIYLSDTNGMLTPETPIGGIGRLVILACSIWVIIIASAFQKAIQKRNDSAF